MHPICPMNANKTKPQRAPRMPLHSIRFSVSSLLLLPGQSCGPPHLSVSFGQPSTGFHQLNAVDNLFSSHDRETDTSKSPRESRVHLICSRIFQCRSTIRIGEEEACGGRRTPGLKCRCGSVVRNLEKGRGQVRRRERKKVQGNEE